MPEAITIRSGGAGDLDVVERIQQSSPGAARWPAADYLAHDLRVALVGTRVAGFYVARRTGPDETELLNVAVDPELRRKGIGKRLLQDLLERSPGTVFLEVRVSNKAARKLYQSLCFEVVTFRKGYYSDPEEDAVVMKNSSCYCHK